MTGRAMWNSIATLEALIIASLRCRGGRRAVDGDSGRCGVEVLVLDAAHVAAIDGVGEVCAEARDVEERSALADLLIGGKGDAELAVRQLLFDKGLGSGQDLSDAGFIVSAQQVVPSVVMRVSPFSSFRKGKVEVFMTMPVPGRVTSPPS